MVQDYSVQLRTLTLLLLLYVTPLHQIVAQTAWQPTVGPYGGSVEALVTSADRSIFLAMKSGLYVSRTNGAAWEPTGHFTSNPVLHLANDQEENLYAGTENGLFRSTDYGSSWELFGFEGKPVVGFARRDDGMMLSATNNDLYRSTDNGTTWQGLDIGFANISHAPIAFDDNGTIFVGGGSVVYRSTNNSESWEVVMGIVLIPEAIPPVFSSIVTGKDGLVLATLREIDIHYQNPQLHRSIDGGDSWHSDTVIGADRVRVQAYTVAKNSEGTFFVGTPNGVMLTDDPTASWTSWQQFKPGQDDIVAITFGANGDVIAGTDRTGAYRVPKDGSSEAWVGDRLELQEAFALAKAPGLQNMSALAATTHDVYYLDQGQNWERQKLQGVRIADMTQDGNNAYIVVEKLGLTSERFQLGKSSDWSNSYWEWKTLPVVASTGPRIIRVLDNETLILVSMKPVLGSGGGLYRSTDGGDTWASVASLKDVNDIVELHGNLFAGTGKNGIWHSDNRGESWTQLQTTISVPAYDLLALPGQSAQEDIILAATQDGLYESNDQGYTWSLVSNTRARNLPTDQCNALAYVGPREILVGTENLGVFKSIDNGFRWEELNTGLPNDAVISLRSGRNGITYAGTRNSGVWEAQVQTSVLPPVELDIALTNIPDPFNTHTSINVTVQQKKHAVITLHNVLGQIIDIVHDGVLASGVHQFKLDGTDLENGTYFVRLTLGNRVLTEPLTVQH